MSNFLEAEISWKNFLDKKVLEYSFKRNYDYGPYEESAVSKLSPFITHRILFEFKLIKELQNNYEINKVNKFIEEIYWRIYWKGWLEHNPSLWEHFLSIETKNYDKELYSLALEGKTNLSFFNSWIFELREFNYLHNHTRMWFASTWIFNLGLPWELGAKLFFEHLYDGDAASNLLSWRWVAGLQTKGKQYFFTPENLIKFSNERFYVKSIHNKKINILDKYEAPPSEEIFSADMSQKSDELIIFENDLNIETLRNVFKNYRNVFLVLLENQVRDIKLSENVMNFKREIVLEFAKKVSNIKLINSKEFLIYSKNKNQFDLLYPCVGENLNFIKKYKLKNNITIHNLVRSPDLYAWKFAKKGFFKFKENIPSINKYIEKMVW